MKYIIANWKSHKTNSETKSWLNDFFQKVKDFGERTLIIAPPYHLIPDIYEFIGGRKNVYVASQDISRFPIGSFTGEVAAALLKEFVKYSIIGHSERRQHIGEDNETLSQKTNEALKNSIEPIFCIRNLMDPIPKGINFIAYEPVGAIGTGFNEPISAVLSVKKQLGLLGDKKFIYGGSINPKNYKTYLQSPEIDGLLVGTTSLDPSKFAQLFT